MFDSALFLFQIAVIIGFSRVTGWFFQKIGQPLVVGEMAAGIALGPTLFGSLAPGAYHAFFPAASLGYLGALSEAGLVVFIFLVGVRVDFAELRQQSRIAIVTSNVSVILPFLTGAGLAWYLFPRYGSGRPWVFALFIGTAISVTAFPVLARILVERNLLNTRLGSVAITCAAFGDLMAWILLAVIVTVTGHQRHARSVWATLALTGAYMGTMMVAAVVLRLFVPIWPRRADANRQDSSLGPIVIFVVLALASAAASEWIGIHAFVGAFAAGLITPRRFGARLIDKLEAVTLVLLIPLFFVLTGIRTNLLFTGGSGAWFDLCLILMIAVVSKWGGTLLGARIGGMSWQDASRLGLLMNTRGLVELIVLNVGIEDGILQPSLFSMMVCMALVTTFMATPLMSLGTHSLAAAAANRR
jgi:Kef-type K+ transport system membrane component KefB